MMPPAPRLTEQQQQWSLAWQVEYVVDKLAEKQRDPELVVDGRMLVYLLRAGMVRADWMEETRSYLNAALDALAWREAA